MRLLAIVAIMLLVGAISPALSATDVRVSGSTTVLPLASVCAESFNSEQSDYRVTVTGGGTGVGITDLGEGRSDIAMASREVTETEKNKYETADKKFNEILVGYDGIVVALSPQIYEAGVRALTKEQVRKIYAGEISNWKDLGGPDMKIYAIARRAGSGTRDTFNEVIMGSKEAETPGVSTEAADNSEVKTAIKGSDKAIGYLGYSYVADGAVKGVALDGVEPTVDNIKSGNYPLARKLYFYTLGEPSPGAQAFIDFVLSSSGQALAEKAGYIPL
ncbi:MAG: phosphate ABC transporter substrate-binding protein [Methanothrix sp.]|uniref:phosphate ABC transporter substrate-binding protein n=1 Tax=Methanothrix sp. TaxID=90426 RepID=UPI0025FB02EB|nr:phosphate ABC transporter substrate-binding protein [Methanothrix sp.]MCQ8903989.1 phosphate ABC transporter substrate-binding protein [Methanothrix sp.]